MKKLILTLFAFATLQNLAQAQTVTQADATGFTSYAGMYVITGSAVTTSTNSATYTPLLFSGTSGVNTAYLNAVPDKTNSRIQVNMTGQYYISWHMTAAQSGTTTVTVVPFIDTTELVSCESAAYVSGTNAFALSGQGIVSVASVSGTTGYIGLQVRSGTSVTVTPATMSLSVRRIAN